MALCSHMTGTLIWPSLYRLVSLMASVVDHVAESFHSFICLILSKLELFYDVEIVFYFFFNFTVLVGSFSTLLLNKY